MNRTAFWAIIGTLLVGGVWAITWMASQSAGEGETVVQEETAQIRESDQVKGSREASLVLVEYSDFQCPACQFYAGWISQLAETYGDDLAFVYRHFPLRSIHAQAEQAAIAAEAAGRQGMFWEYHDVLFQRQKEWAESGSASQLFLSYAQTLGLDVEAFASDMKDSEIQDKVRRDLAEGQVLGVRGTPTFFLQGVRIQNPQTYAELEQHILRELQKN
ncbi:MAG: thioredoxin domain-containing protein [bacterium]|nr:thioredoxin domain-containing protein [bacterium]